MFPHVSAGTRKDSLIPSKCFGSVPEEGAGDAVAALLSTTKLCVNSPRSLSPAISKLRRLPRSVVADATMG